MKIQLSVVLSIMLLAAISAPLHADESEFYIRVGAGASFPSLKNLNAELVRQGNKTVQPGYSFAFAFGRYLGEKAWSLELDFSASYYPNFDYIIPGDSALLHSFPGKLRHYNYMLVLHRYLWPGGTVFKPSIGAGLGYGTAGLISGGGKIGAVEALVTGRIESSITKTIDLSLECTYYSGLSSQTFSNPFLENVDTDYIVTSQGRPLKDTFRSLDVRLGITVRLKQMGTQ
jgi:hypothetical protein